MKITTFNINNDKRLGNLLAWLEAAKTDVVWCNDWAAENSLIRIAVRTRNNC